MDTAAAAERAEVTTATIRYWCRIGAVAAVRTNGRWDINSASLNRRLAIGRERDLPRVQAAADRSRTRILAMVALQLPALQGSPKQIAWATDLRRQRIEEDLYVFAATTGRGGVRWRLTGPQNIDRLGMRWLRRVHGRDLARPEPESEAQALTGLVTAVTSPGRDQAAWWIDNRWAAGPSHTRPEQDLHRAAIGRRAAERAEAAAASGAGSAA